MNDNPFRIRLSLKSSLPKKKKGKNTNGTSTQNNNHVITITPSMSISDLESTIHDVFGTSAESSSFDIELYSGFPPRQIDIGRGESMSTKKSTLLVSKFIRSGENVIVKYIEKAKSGNKKKTATKKRPLNQSDETHMVGDASKSNDSTTNNSSTTTTSRGRPKRAAANVASASFKDVIEEQDKLLQNERLTMSRKTQNSTKQPVTINNINRKRKAAAEARAAAANSRRMASLPGGRTLNDSSDKPKPAQTKFDSASRAAPPKRNSSTAPNIFKGMKSEEDISFALLSSVNSAGSSKKVSKVLRSAMRRTVEKSYEASRAVVRGSAITSGDISFQNSSSQILQQQGTCNDVGTFTVKYPKGIEGIGYYEDENIHIISIDTLKAVILSVYESDKDNDVDISGDSGKEMLKPNNMALLSPRVFWSLWFHYQHKCQSIEEALQSLLPELDWKFLFKRSRQLSEKAKENLRQKQNAHGMQDREENSQKEEEYEASLNAVKDVEETMENMYQQGDVVSLRARAAEAALLRIKNKNKSTEKWNFVNTPIEVDLDELNECILEAVELDQKTLTSKEVNACSNLLVSRLSINNWRMLANIDSKEISADLISIIPEMNESVIDGMISAAQERSMEEIMMEIVNGNHDIYQILREEASSVTPQDLSLWKMIPHILLEIAPSLVSKCKVSEQNIISWCDAAEIAMESFKWLSEFSTSISTS